MASDNVGRRVLITGRNHPWRNHAGEIVGSSRTSAGAGYVVLLDCGSQSMVFAGDFRWLPKELPSDGAE